MGAYVTHGRGVTKATIQRQSLGTMVHQLARLEPSIGDYTTAMIVQAESIGLHRDLHNAGQSWTLALGDFSAGHLWCEHPQGRYSPPGLLKGETPLRGEWYHTHWQWTPLSVQRWHAVEAWKGCRWAVILYTPIAVEKLPPVDWATLHQAGFPVLRLQAELLDPGAQKQFHCIINKACRGSRIGACAPAAVDPFNMPKDTRRCCSCARHVHVGGKCAWCPHWVCQRCVCPARTPNGVDLMESQQMRGHCVEIVCVRLERRTQQMWLQCVKIVCVRLAMRTQQESLWCVRLVSAQLELSVQRERCNPVGDADEQERVWAEFWDSIELIRVLTSRPETWAVAFTNGLKQLLDPHERMEIPGEDQNIVWLGGDATLTRGAAIDWTNEIYVHYPVQEALAYLAEAAGEETEEAMIALAELQVVVCLVALQSSAWAGKLVLNVTDNMNVKNWVNHRRARNR
eukprot:3659119-Amphidinium_carterae.1